MEGERGAGSDDDDWLAGSQSQPSHGLNSGCAIWQKRRDRVPGKSRKRDVECVGYHARKLQWLRPRLGRSGVRCLAAWPSGLMKGALEINSGHDTGWGEGVVSGWQGRRSKLPVTSLGRELAGVTLGLLGRLIGPCRGPVGVVQGSLHGSSSLGRLRSMTGNKFPTRLPQPSPPLRPLQRLPPETGSRKSQSPNAHARDSAC